jgi:hypothetical protein
MSAFIAKTDNLGNQVLVGMAKLANKLSDNWREYVNANGETKRYKLTTVEIVTPSGKKTTLAANVAEKNIQRMEESGSDFEVGSSYLTTLQRVERRDGEGMITLARMSHLQNAVADESVLDELFAEVAEEVTVNA